MVWVNHSSLVLKVFGALMLLVHWCDFDTVAYEFLDGSVTGPSNCCLASWNGMFFWFFTLMISFSLFHWGNFSRTLDDRHYNWHILLRFFVFAFKIIMSSLSTFCTFWFVFAESFVLAIFLTIKTTLWIWNVNFCVTNQESNFDLRGYVWTINGQYVWIGRYQLPILSPLHAFNFGYNLWFQLIFMSSSSIFPSSLHPITHIEELSVLWGVTFTGTSISLSALRRLSL